MRAFFGAFVLIALLSCREIETSRNSKKAKEKKIADIMESTTKKEDKSFRKTRFGVPFFTRNNMPAGTSEHHTLPMHPSQRQQTLEDLATAAVELCRSEENVDVEELSGYDLAKCLDERLSIQEPVYTVLHPPHQENPVPVPPRRRPGAISAPSGRLDPVKSGLATPSRTLQIPTKKRSIRRTDADSHGQSSRHLTHPHYTNYGDLQEYHPPGAHLMYSQQQQQQQPPIFPDSPYYSWQNHYQQQQVQHQQQQQSIFLDPRFHDWLDEEQQQQQQQQQQQHQQQGELSHLDSENYPLFDARFYHRDNLLLPNNKINPFYKGAFKGRGRGEGSSQ